MLGEPKHYDRRNKRKTCINKINKEIENVHPEYCSPTMILCTYVLCFSFVSIFVFANGKLYLVVGLISVKVWWWQTIMDHSIIVCKLFRNYDCLKVSVRLSVLWFQHNRNWIPSRNETDSGLNVKLLGSMPLVKSVCIKRVSLNYHINCSWL